jgi:hypothetical protein
MHTGGPLLHRGELEFGLKVGFERLQFFFEIISKFLAALILLIAGGTVELFRGRPYFIWPLDLE